MVNLYEIATPPLVSRNDRWVKRRRYEQDKESEHYRREMYYAYTSEKSGA